MLSTLYSSDRLSDKVKALEASGSCPTCGTPIPKASPIGLCPRCCLLDIEHHEPEMENELPGYEFIRVLGEGSFGIVYEYLQKELLVRRVAVKILKREMRERADRMLQEIQMLAQLNHQGIARLLDAGHLNDGRPFYSMELVEGETLDCWLSSGQFHIRDKILVFWKAAKAVGYVHDCGIVHRDLKPQNIMVCRQDGDWQVKLLDFGVARAFAGTASFGAEATEYATRIGTPAYMSPEQLKGEINPQPPSDVYTLGILLYELISKVPLFGENDKGVSWMDAYEKRRNWVAPSWSNIKKLQPTCEKRVRSLTWVARKAIDWEPGNRYPTANEMADDLDRWLVGDSLSVGRKSLHTRVTCELKKHKSALAILLIGMCLISGFFMSAKMSLTFPPSVEQGNSGFFSADRSESLHQTALVYLEAGKPQLAIETLGQAERIAPNNHEINLARRLVSTIFPQVCPLPSIDLPFAAVDLKINSRGDWQIKDADGAWFIFRGEGQWESIAQPEEQTDEDLPAGGESLVRVREVPLGELRFFAEGIKQPIAQLKFSELDSPVAVDFDRHQVIALATNGKSLNRWSFAKLWNEFYAKQTKHAPTKLNFVDEGDILEFEWEDGESKRWNYVAENSAIQSGFFRRLQPEFHSAPMDYEELIFDQGKNSKAARSHLFGGVPLEFAKEQVEAYRLQQTEELAAMQGGQRLEPNSSICGNYLIDKRGGSLVLVDLQTNSELVTLEQADPVDEVLVIPSLGVVVLRAGGRVVSYLVDNGEPVSTLQLPKSSIDGAPSLKMEALGDSGLVIISNLGFGKAVAWDLKNSANPPFDLNLNGRIIDANCDPQKKYFWVVEGASFTDPVDKIRLWSMATRREIILPIRFRDALTSATFNPQMDRLAIAFRYGEIRVIKLN